MEQAFLPTSIILATKTFAPSELSIECSSNQYWFYKPGINIQTKGSVNGITNTLKLLNKKHNFKACSGTNINGIDNIELVQTESSSQYRSEAYLIQTNWLIANPTYGRLAVQHLY